MKNILASILVLQLLVMATSVRIERHREYIAVRCGQTIIWSHDWIAEPPAGDE